MNNRVVYSAIASLSAVAAGNVQATENNQDYIKLAAIYPIVELDASVKLSSNTQSYDDRKKDEADAKGYESGITCPPADDPTLCVRVPMDETGIGSTFYKCTCYCNGQNTCMEMGYTKTSCSTGEIVESRCMIDNKYVRCICNPCSGYTYSNSCPSGWNSTGSCNKCGTIMHTCKITPQQQCKDAGYVYNKTCTSAHPTHEKPTNCSYDSSYKKCVSMTTTEMCSTDGYTHTGNCTKYENKTNCPHNSTYNKCTAMSAGEKCVVDGYVSGKTCTSSHPTHQKAVNCPYSSTYKKCVSQTSAEMCTTDGYAYNKTCSGYYKSVTCSHNSSYKKCVAMTAQEKCVKDGYVSGKTCDGSHTTHQKRAACPYVSTYYKCVSMTTQEKCNTDGYYKTSCQTGYALKNKCSHGNYYLQCEITPAQKCKDAGYTQTSCGAYYDVVNCPYTSTYKKCNATCESNLVAKGYKVNQNYSGAIITKNYTISGSTAPNVYSVESYRSTPLCTTSLRPKPTLTLSGVTRMQRYYNGLNIKTTNTTSVEVGGSTINNGHADFGTANVYAYKGSFTHKSTGSKVNFKAGIFGCASGGYSCYLDNVTTTLTRLVANNGGNVHIKNTNFYADELRVYSAGSYETEFSNNSYIRVKHTILGQDNYVRGARLRIKGGSKWYMSYGDVVMSDGAHFCVYDNDGSYIYFRDGYKKGGRGRAGYDGCRIYHDKTRTISYTNWDPSSYTSWTIRSYCAE